MTEPKPGWIPEAFASLDREAYGIAFIRNGGDVQKLEAVAQAALREHHDHGWETRLNLVTALLNLYGEDAILRKDGAA